ncbi:GIY-YIG nuclease family protein [Candidatus Gottesmanbacteria bacterium]|nr:GIY-YIG nuclease family protein [Candidatus Gottesmanbacteria bacterium]
MISRQYAIYIMTNRYGSVFYTGVTNDIIKRIYQHKQLLSGFTAKYKLIKLVYYELFPDVRYAIAREKQIKGGSRKDKINLIMRMNPKFRDLYNNIL